MNRKSTAVYLKKVLKIFSIIIAVILVMIIILSVIAKVKENYIAGIALRKISKSINAPIAVDNISLSLIRRFPLATIKIDGVWLGSADAFGLSDSLITEKETLVRIERVYVSAKTRPLFKGEFEIMRVEIKGADLSYIVNTRGISNFDFLISSKKKDISDTTSAGLNLLLKELILRDIRCNYYDSLRLISARVVIPKSELRAEIRGEYIHVYAKGMLKLSNCNYKVTNLHYMKETEIDFNVTYSENTVDVKELVLSTDGADFVFNGNAVIKDSIEMDIHMQGNQINIDKFIKYIPEKTLEHVGLKKASGVLKMDASIKGFVSDSILPEVKMNVAFRNGYIQTVGYPPVKNISFTGYLTNGVMKNNKTTSFSITKFHAETRKSNLDMSFSINDLDRKQYKINSNMEIDLGEFREYLPDTNISVSKGQFAARFASGGVFPDSIGNDFIDYLLKESELDLTFADIYLGFGSGLSISSLSGQLAYDLHHITARDLRFSIPSHSININNASFDARLSGKISEPSNLDIDLRSIQVRTDSCVFYGAAKIQNLKAPEFNITSNMKLNLGEIKAIIPDTLVNFMAGEITAQIASSGKLNLDSIANQINDLVFKNSTFRIDFDMVSIDMPDTLMSVREFSGKLYMKPDTIKIYSTNGIYNGIDFAIDSTRIVNLYNSVIKNQSSRLYVEGRFSLGDLDYNNFTPFMARNAYSDADTVDKEDKDMSSTAKIEDSAASDFKYLIKGKLRIRSLTYKKAVAENISALFNLTDSLYLVDQLRFSGFDGKINTSVRYSVKDEEKILWVKNIIEKMNVTRLLEDFGNFRDFYEPAITCENLSGILSSRVDAQIYFEGDSMIRSKMYVRGDIKLEKGGIYNYQPVMDMEQHLKGVSNLDRLEFKTINSNVFVFQDAVYVPTTLIVSNKLDATALGMQTFGEDYSYHFIVYLRDILTGKSKKLIEKQDKIGDEITSAGRKGTLVKSYSINGKSRSGLDNKNDQEKMRSRVKASEALLNLRFHPNIANYNTGVK